MYPLMPFVRSHSPATRIGSWAIGAASAYTRFILPAALGGLAETLLALPPPGDGGPFQATPIPLTGEIITIPGLPPFYDYEAFPQDHAIPAAFIAIEGLVTRYADILLSLELL
jgi:hypothetical protein